MAIYYLSGQPGSGKTTLAKKLQEFLETERRNWRKPVFHIDGDDLRNLFPNQDYSKEGRTANMRMANSLATYLHKHGCDVVISLVAPFAEIRNELYDMVRGDMFEFYIFCSDIRGREHYHIDYYEVPTNPLISVDTTKDTTQESFSKIVSGLNGFDE